MLKEEIKKILEDKCDLFVRDNKINNNSLRHWKLAGIIQSKEIVVDKVLYEFSYSSQLRVILDSGNIMWTEKFQLALVSSNIYEEIMVLINPGELDFYALTDYEDIISLLETEFIEPYINSEKPLLYTSTTINNISNQLDGYYYHTWSSPYISSTTIDNDYLKSTISTSIEDKITTTSTANF